METIWMNLKKQMKFIWYNTAFFFEDWTMHSANRTDILNNSGRVLLITGGTRGIGVEVIKMLLQCDFKIIIGCRTVKNATTLLYSARCDGIMTGDIVAYHLDVGSFKLVKEFAKTVKENHPKIDILVNNAGVLNVPFKLTEDGIESVFATNYLGHFLLTHLLLPQLIKASQNNYRPRIVNVSSCAHFTGKIKFEDINYSKNYNYPDVYSQSKLAQVMFTKYLSKQLEIKGINIGVFCLHPGMCRTDIFNDTLMKKLGFHIFFKSAKQGAIPIVHTCVSPFLNDRNGVYISNCRIKETAKQSEDIEAQEKLFKLSRDMVKVKDYFEGVQH